MVKPYGVFIHGFNVSSKLFETGKDAKRYFKRVKKALISEYGRKNLVITDKVIKTSDGNAKASLVHANELL